VEQFLRQRADRGDHQTPPAASWAMAPTALAAKPRPIPSTRIPAPAPAARAIALRITAARLKHRTLNGDGLSGLPPSPRGSRPMAYPPTARAMFQTLRCCRQRRLGHLPGGLLVRSELHLRWICALHGRTEYVVRIRRNLGRHADHGGHSGSRQSKDGGDLGQHRSHPLLDCAERVRHAGRKLSGSAV